MIKATITNTISRIFGKFASKEFIAPLQYLINFVYVKTMGVELDEFKPLEYYKSLNKLFTRKLEVEREFNKSQYSFISPCDGLVSEAGEIFISKSMQIKGSFYSVDDLLTNNIEQSNIQRLYNGNFINLYLSPKDYHRYHVPIDMRVKKAVHVPGFLYSVNLKYLKRIPNLFIKNERVILECYTKDDKLFYMVFVGALNVGKMRFVFDDRIQTNSEKDIITTYIYGNVELKKGDELGRFEMGSTIVIFFEKEMADLTISRMKPVRFGDTIAIIKK